MTRPETASKSSEPTSLKSAFPFFKKHPDLVYLDSAATTQKPKPVITAIKNFYEAQNANPGRGLYQLGYEATELHADCRQTVASFLNADSEQIIFTSSATESLNLVALHFAELADSPASDFILGPGDEIVVSIFEHHSNFVPWQHLARKTGATLRILYNFEADLAQITDKTKIVAITAVSNVTGAQTPLAQVVKKAHAVGAQVVCDATQMVAHLPLDVEALDVDFLAFSGHKMYGPMGIGVLYAKNPNNFSPVFFGGGAIAHVSTAETELAPDTSRFEPGTRNLEAELGLKTAIDWLQGVRQKPDFSSQPSKSAKTNLEQTLVQLAHDELTALPFVELISPRDAIGIVSFNLQNIHPHDVATILNDEGICIRAGNHCAEPLMIQLEVSGCCRASFGLYNDKNDVKRLIASIKQAWEILK